MVNSLPEAKVRGLLAVLYTLAEQEEGDILCNTPNRHPAFLYNM